MSGASPLESLLERLDLEALDADLFLGDPGPGTGTLFGGMVAAQSVMAAARTVDAKRRLHSLHGYFLRPGRHDVPIRFVVDRIRDGRSFTTRRVKAHQAGEAIFNMSASFTRPEDGISHQDAMPEAPAPDEAESWEEIIERLTGAPAVRHQDSPVEVRLCDPPARERRPARQRVWMRIRGEAPQDPFLRTALLVYATDRTLLSTAVRPHGIHWGRGMTASLDHAVWIHREVEIDGWLLFASESPVAHQARGLVFGGVFRPDGTRLASVAQEALIRLDSARG